jgi:tetratricopeptide (TPR) repeat protein
MAVNTRSPRHGGLVDRVLTTLGILQLATLTAFAATIFISILVLHHETEDYFIPLPSYLASIKVAVPPIAIFLVTYVFAFITGTALADAPKAVLSFAKNTFFQSAAMMVFALAISCTLIGYGSWLLAKTTPPSYEQMIKLLLGGSSDNMAIVREKIDVVRKSNPELASRLVKVTEVFLERYAVNAGQRTLSGERARTFVRALEADAEGDWKEHPLRVHALAEAYSMFGQSVAQASTLISAAAVQDATSPFMHAIELYSQVIASPSPLAPAALRVSALVNTGNAYYYMKDYAGALAAWRAATSEKEGQPNLSPWSNVVAALVMLDRPNDAIKEGERARAWAERSGRALIETYPFAGVLENMAFAKMQVGDNLGALADLATANAFREDDLTRQNFALALILTGRYDDAQKILRKIAPPVDTRTPPDDKIARCVYFIWALTMPKGPISSRAANFIAFLNERHSSEEISGMTADGLRQLVERVSEALPKADLPCGSIGKIKSIAKLLSPS